MKIIQHQVITDLALHLVGACAGYERESLETVGRFLSPCQSHSLQSRTCGYSVAFKMILNKKQLRKYLQCQSFDKRLSQSCARMCFII